MAEGGDADQYLSPRLSDADKNTIVSTVEGLGDASPEVSGLDASMTECDATVTVELSQGGTLTYDVHFVRSSNYIGWAVESFTPNFGDLDSEPLDGSDAQTDASATDDQTVTPSDGEQDASAADEGEAEPAA